jgi:uncharacterized protein (UPF0335 family)
MSDLRALTDRIMALKDQQDELGSDIRDIYAEAKAAGYDKTALGQAIGTLRRRAKDPKAFDERSDEVALYLDEIENGAQHSAKPSRTHARARDDGGKPAQFDINISPPHASDALVANGVREEPAAVADPAGSEAEAKPPLPAASASSSSSHEDGIPGFMLRARAEAAA